MFALLRSRVAHWLSALAFGLFAAAPAWADPPGRVGRLADVTGQVWMYDDATGEWVAALRNQPLTSGDRLSTERDARAVIEVGSSTLRLDANTEFEIQQLDDSTLRVQLQSGSVALRLRSAEMARQLEVVTGEGRFYAQRTGHFRIDRDDAVSSATVWSGALQFRSDDSELPIETGRRFEFWREGDRTHYSWRDSERDAFADWVLAEDARDERRAANRYVSPEMTGAEDLDRHGRWETSSEYGSLWVPYTVAPGWAPYRYGRWTWVSPWGWSWVDDAPWGFAPFHYGRWVSFGGRWCWAPGSYVARPVYAPALVAWVGTPGLSVSVNIGSRPPAVGWFPLAPREVYVPTYRVSPVYIRNVNVTHVTNINTATILHPPASGAPALRYANRHVPNAVTAVAPEVIGRRQPVGQHADMRFVREIEREPVRVGLPVASLVSRPDVRPRGADAEARAIPAPPNRLGAEPRPMRQRSERLVRTEDRPVGGFVSPALPAAAPAPAMQVVPRPSPAPAPAMQIVPAPTRGPSTATSPGRGLSTAASPGQGPSTAASPGAGPSTQSAPIVRPTDRSFFQRPAAQPRHDVGDDGWPRGGARVHEGRGRGDPGRREALAPSRAAQPGAQVAPVQVPQAPAPAARVSPVPLQRPAMPPQAAAMPVAPAPAMAPMMRAPSPAQPPDARPTGQPRDQERGPQRGNVRERER